VKDFGRFEESERAGAAEEILCELQGKVGEWRIIQP